MGKAILIAVGIVLLLFALFDLKATPRHQVKIAPKAAWAIGMIVVPVIGPLLWLFWGHSKDNPPHPRNPGWTPPPGPRGPDDDPDYLRGL